MQGRVRDVSYTLNYVKSDSQMRDFSDSTLINRDGKDYILTVYKGRKNLEERITSLDKIRSVSYTHLDVYKRQVLIFLEQEVEIHHFYIQESTIKGLK